MMMPNLIANLVATFGGGGGGGVPLKLLLLQEPSILVSHGTATDTVVIFVL